jgi:hypothetical protein
MTIHEKRASVRATRKPVGAADIHAFLRRAPGR